LTRTIGNHASPGISEDITPRHRARRRRQNLSPALWASP